MEKMQFMKLWFVTFIAIGALAALVQLAQGDYKGAIIAFAAAMVAAVISWIYLNELYFKKGAKALAAKALSKANYWRCK